MNIFVKIFLWFLAAIVLMIGVMLFLNWTVQTEPVVGRWRMAVKNHTNIYSETARQIYDKQGEEGLTEFLNRIRQSETIGEVDLIGENGKTYMSEGVVAENYRDLVMRTLASDTVEYEFPQSETALTARRVQFAGGERYVLIVRWDRPRITPFFGESPLKYLRYAALLATAFLLCWILARYLSSPIGKLRKATLKLAEGDLSVRVASEVGERRDEISALAKDFDLMAERIESLINSQKRLSRDVSHELRSPLARMNVALEIAKKKASPEVSSDLERIENESARLNDMISRLLTLSKLESGSQEFEKTNINLKRLVEEVADDADFEAKAKGRSVKTLEIDECRIMGDESLIQSAIENVLRNAVRYTGENTGVTVSLRSADGKAVVTITDEGGGVPEKELSNLFKPFYRVGEARDRGSGGIGLGLAIAEQAVRIHKGEIRARNTEKGLEVKLIFAVKG